MKKDSRFFLCVFFGLIIAAGVLMKDAAAEPSDVGYRKLMLGDSREKIRDIIKNDFERAYIVSNEGENALALKKMVVDKTVFLIELIFDHKAILYKINVKIRKLPGNPDPDEVFKVIEDKYGAPAKRDITNTLDLIATWILHNGRYEIFFHNISSWDNFDVQYTDTVLQKQKEQYDKEMKKKPAKKELEF